MSVTDTFFVDRFLIPITFTQLRESDPKLFFSRAFNKIWYIFAGGEEVLNASYADLPQNVILEADGVEM